MDAEQNIPLALAVVAAVAIAAGLMLTLFLHVANAVRERRVRRHRERVMDLYRQSQRMSFNEPVNVAPAAQVAPLPVSTQTPVRPNPTKERPEGFKVAGVLRDRTKVS